MGFAPRKVDQYAVRAIHSHDMFYTGSRPGSTTASTSSAWVAQVAIYVPFRIHERVTIYEWFWVNGGVSAAHNDDFGVYREDFTAIQRLGSTAGALTTTTLINTTTWTDLTLDPGSYYMGFWCDATHTFVSSIDSAGLYQAMGCMEETGLATGLPATATPVVYSRAQLPVFGMNCYSVAL